MHFIRYQPDPMTDFHEAKIGIVVTEQQTIFRTRREHSIRLSGIFGDQIINQHANIGLGTVEYKRLISSQLECCIHAGHDPWAPASS